MRPALLFLLVAAAGCTGSQALHLSRADVVGTTWRETCLSPQIATAYVRLDADGHMAWSYDGPDSLLVEDGHTWAVEDGKLLLKWNLGSATSRYPAGPDPAHLVADSSTFCIDALPWIDRLR